MAVQMMQGVRADRSSKVKSLQNGGTMSTGTYLIIRLPDPSIFKLLARSFFLALFIVSLPWMASCVRGAQENNIPNVQITGSDLVNLDIFPSLLHDLTNEGIMNSIEKSLVFSYGKENSEILNGKDVDFISTSDLERQNEIPNESFDFIFTNAFHVTAQEFIDRTLKIGGIVVIQLSENPSSAFNKPSNYRAVYVRKFDKTVLGIKKTNYYFGASSATQRKLLSHTSEAKKAALKNLEDVLLEPPRAASGKSNRYLKRTKYLPDLMGDSLESYPRRVFIDVGLPEKEGGSGTGWFNKNYPTRKLHFDMYKIETIPETNDGEETSTASSDEFNAPMPEMGMSDWLGKNVKEEEYVVMKAEAEVVEEMVKTKAIDLVDELFLECKPQKHNEKIISRGSRRAYWECLALYGRLRDEGVAVHQWWG
ncbi:hypothetical protein ACFE04_008852 [Oxalis oulophora]